MFPIILDPQHVNFILVGEGTLASKRLVQLRDSGVEVKHFTSFLPSDHDLRAAHIVYIVDLPEDEAEKLARRCRELGVLVNVEDVIPLCDFHTPSIVKSGDLLLSISTRGKSPGLARRLRKHLSQSFGDEWGARLDLLAEKRQGWRAQGLGLKDVAQKTDEFIDEQEWLSPPTKMKAD